MAAINARLLTRSASHPIGYCNAMLPSAITVRSRMASASSTPCPHRVDRKEGQQHGVAGGEHEVPERRHRREPHVAREPPGGRSLELRG